MWVRGVSSQEETIVFYKMNNSQIELQQTSWGTMERMTLGLNDENSTRVTLNLECIFSIQPTTIVLNSTLTKYNFVKVCELRLKTVDLEDEKVIRFPKNVRHLNIIRSNLLRSPRITNHTSATTKTNRTERF